MSQIIAIAIMSQSMFAGSSKKASPWKKKSPPKKASSKTNKAVQHLLTCFSAVPESPMELCAFQRTNQSGRVEGYTKSFRDFIDSEEKDIPNLSKAGFCAHYTQRRSREQNLIKTGVDGWARYCIVRIVPDNVPSTEDTRRQGLDVLATFLMDSNYSRYPPSSIVRIDVTNQVDLTNPNDGVTALDHHLLDRDIVSAMSLLFDEEALNTQFARNMADIARYFFSGPIYATIAIETLGYGSHGESRIVQVDGNTAAVVPGMNLPGADSVNDGDDIKIDTSESAGVEINEHPPLSNGKRKTRGSGSSGK